jgi:hypothetical protein
MNVLLRAIEEAPFGKDISVVLSGAQATYDRNTGLPIGGTDWLGEQWAAAHNIPVERYPARWDDLSAEGAVVLTGFGGRPYNAKAGPDRNAKMLDASPEAVLAIWDEKSKGTGDLLRQAIMRKKRGQKLLLHVHYWRPK